MKKDQPTSLVLVIPAYNEAECIERVVINWLDYLDGKLNEEIAVHMIVINDGSKDATGEILDAIANERRNLSVIHQKNGGHGNALLNGYHTAIKQDPDFVFQVDSDDQFTPEDFLKLWEKKEQSDFITGYRKERHDDLSRIFITRILRTLLYIVFQQYLKDSNVPYRLIRGNYLRELLGRIPERPFAPNIFLAVMAKSDGQNLFEIPIGHKERKTGTVSIVKWNLLKVCFRSMMELLRFRMRLSSAPKNQVKLNTTK